MDKIRNKTSTISQTIIEGSRKLAIEGESYKNNSITESRPTAWRKAQFCYKGNINKKNLTRRMNLSRKDLATTKPNAKAIATKKCEELGTTPP